MQRVLILAGALAALACSVGAGTHASGGHPGDSNQVTGPPPPPTTGPDSPNEVTQNPNIPVEDPNTPPQPPPLINTFTQGLWRGEDVRVSQANGFYYTVYRIGEQRVMFKSVSLIDRGVGKQTPPNFPLYAPQWIDRLGGVTYNAWFAFDGNVWRCDCADPYDNLDQWRLVKSIPFSSLSLDMEVFRNPDPGPYQGHWYMVWAGATYGTVGWGPENLYIAEVLDLRAGQQTLSYSDNTTLNTIVEHHSWSEAVVEGAGTFIHGSRPALVYSGNGAQTSNYALGVAFLVPGANPTAPTSWIDHNNGGCDDTKYGPDFARTASVFGPGVARLAHSLDGNQDWMLYHSKTWDTYEANGVPAGQQTHNQQWTRQVMLQPIGWRQLTCDGNTYDMPDLGTPVPAGATQTAPSGDRGLGPLDAARRTEAEIWLPYGEVMGPSIQNLQGPGGDLDVISPANPNYSAGRKMANLKALAQDTNTTPKRSGLVWHNAPPASGLRIAAAATAPASLDLYLDGAYVQTLPFRQTPDLDTFAITLMRVPIARGSTVELRYVMGANDAPDLDYIEFLP